MPFRNADRHLSKIHVSRQSPGSSGNLEWFTQFGIFRSDPATGLAGKFHCAKFLSAHVGGGNIAVTTVRTGDRFNGRIAEMAGVISHRSATFTGMSHNKPPLQA